MITGTSTASLTETDAVLTASGNLDATDVDGSAAFVAQTDVAGSNGYGTFSIDDTGAWTYTTDPSAHDEFVAGTTYTDSITVATADGTTQVITVSILGTNDAAVITGTSTASLTETDAALTASGNLDATDVDSSAAFVAQTDVAGSNGYGTFSIDDTGAWTYTTAPSAHDEFVAGTTYTDSITVATADGTTQVITVSILGTNDAAVITGTQHGEPDGNRRGADRERQPGRHRRRQLGRLRGADRRGRQQRLRHVLDRRHGRLDLHDRSFGSRRVRGRHHLHRQHHGGDGRRHDAGHHRQHPGTNDAAVITGTSTASLTETDAAC